MNLQRISRVSKNESSEYPLHANIHNSTMMHVTRDIRTLEE